MHQHQRGTVLADRLSEELADADDRRVQAAAIDVVRADDMVLGVEQEDAQMLLTERAREAGLKLLIGCMVCTSLGIAPARLLASLTDYADLDGPLLLAGDRHHRLLYENSRIVIPPRELWG